jgi:hypothetical protein
MLAMACVRAHRHFRGEPVVESTGTLSGSLILVRAAGFDVGGNKTNDYTPPTTLGHQDKRHQHCMGLYQSTLGVLRRCPTPPTTGLDVLPCRL